MPPYLWTTLGGVTRFALSRFVADPLTGGEIADIEPPINGFLPIRDGMIGGGFVTFAPGKPIPSQPDRRPEKPMGASRLRVFHDGLLRYGSARGRDGGLPHCPQLRR